MCDNCRVNWALLTVTKSSWKVVAVPRQLLTFALLKCLLHLMSKTSLSWRGEIFVIGWFMFIAESKSTCPIFLWLVFVVSISTRPVQLPGSCPERLVCVLYVHVWSSTNSALCDAFVGWFFYNAKYCWVSVETRSRTVCLKKFTLLFLWLHRQMLTGFNSIW